MLVALRAIRSFVSMLLVGTYFTLGSIILRLAVLPAVWIWPRLRFPLTSVYMRTMARGIFALLTLGGARFRRRGVLPTATPIAIIANHQALTDVLQVSILSQPRVPAYVARTRYGRFIPLVSATMRLLGSPLIQPERDPRGSLKAIMKGARELPHGLLIFPEGHRSSDGSVGPFEVAGVKAMLRARRVPVYLIVNDGVWRVRHFVDLLYRVYLMDAQTEVLGPFEIPEDPKELGAFVEECRDTIIRRLAVLRGNGESEDRALNSA
jgi:1-acyl-sn-glycerol-3-phosphate acyltransferase